MNLCVDGDGDENGGRKSKSKFFANEERKKETEKK